MGKLSREELVRYDRQIRIAGWGEKAQERIKKAKVGILGAGGLGSPVAIYLAVAGIGKLVIADKDKVELSNLNRQILHWDKDIGRQKTESAREKLTSINPKVEIDLFHGEVNKKNIKKVFTDVNVLVDALDNFPSRYILNEFAIKNNLPLFHGSVYGMEGRATTILPGFTACLNCIFPEPPAEQTFPVLGTTPGIIALIQVTEVLKFFTRIGILLNNRLLVYDGEEMVFSLFPVKKNPGCPVCGHLDYVGDI